MRLLCGGMAWFWLHVLRGQCLLCCSRCWACFDRRGRYDFGRRLSSTDFNSGNRLAIRRRKRPEHFSLERPGGFFRTQGHCFRDPPPLADATRSATRRFDDITIDERPPQYSAPRASSALPPPAALDRDSVTKRPATRMPDLSDFPPVAQKEYRAHTERYAGGEQHLPPPPSVYAPGHSAAPAKKRSLIQMLTGAGRVRKANAASAEQATEADLPGFLARNKR